MSSIRNNGQYLLRLALLLVCCSPFSGCGTTKTKTGTDQLLMSNAVDLTVSDLDFSDIAGEKVFLDAKYVTAV